MISSAKNEQVKAVVELRKRSKARDEEGVFVAEGVRILSEIPTGRLKRLYVSEGFLKHDGSADRLLACGFLTPDSDGPGGYELVTDSVFAAMSDTQAPQGVLAVVRQYEYTVEDLLRQSGPAHLLLLENLQDPGNLGTILRAGEGAGITGVIMSRDTVDIYNPKVIRSTMGSVFRVPFVCTDDLKETAKLLKAFGVRLYAADLLGRNNYEREDYTDNTGFLIGNEGNGLGRELLELADCRVRIPMAGKVESLNAAVAASILMFEAARQRRAASEGKE